MGNFDNFSWTVVLRSCNLENLFIFLNGADFLLLVSVIAVFVKLYFVKLIFLRRNAATKVSHTWYLIFGILLSAMMIDFSWALSFFRHSFFGSYRDALVLFVLCTVRIAWIAQMVLWHSIGLLIDTLFDKKFRLRWYNVIFLPVSVCIILFFVYLIITHFYVVDFKQRQIFEYPLSRFTSIYSLLLPLPSVIVCLRKLWNVWLPKIMRKQLAVLLFGLFLPYWLSEFIFSAPFNFFSSIHVLRFWESFSIIIFTISLYFALRKIFNLRFLNSSDEVKSSDQMNFFEDFDGVLKQLSKITRLEELSHVVRGFFRDLLHIPSGPVMLYIRKLDLACAASEPNCISSTEQIVEQFLLQDDEVGAQALAELSRRSVLIYDELIFSQHYQSTAIDEVYLRLLDALGAAVFLPLYAEGTMVGYITIDNDVSIDRLYNNVDRNQMVLFARYLAQMVLFEQSKNVRLAFKDCKMLADELFGKHQQINQYRESISTFTRAQGVRRGIGVLYHNGSQFSFANTHALEMLDFDPNENVDHPIVKNIHELVARVARYRSSQSGTAYDHEGNEVMLDAFPHAEKGCVTVTLAHIELADVIHRETKFLANPSEWDYLLYLKTTEVGKLINRLLPGTGSHLLNFKIRLLKHALTKSVTVLSMTEEDVEAAVEVIHAISLRDTLKIIDLKGSEVGSEAAIRLFGLNALYGTVPQNSDEPLLEHLSGNGTIFIKNVEHLSLQTQQQLAEYLEYGIYRPVKGDQKRTSDTRIIMFSQQDLESLVREGAFNYALYMQIKDSCLELPSLLTLSAQEVSSLVHGIAKQSLINPKIMSLIDILPDEAQKFINKRPDSLRELKEKVHELVAEKARRVKTHETIELDPAMHLNDPQLVKAKRLGKKALKDPKIMGILWRKLDKSQSQMADFLGVNRSSVNRRCREHGLF